MADNGVSKLNISEYIPLHLLFSLIYQIIVHGIMP